METTLKGRIEEKIEEGFEGKIDVIVKCPSQKPYDLLDGDYDFEYIGMYRYHVTVDEDDLRELNGKVNSIEIDVLDSDRDLE